ncbi:hypothetical protein B566_EDAN006885 [Ephemera danica]|nr:hypothetical protein B566_EDAN006885 [Ephemera danica]
MKPTCVQLLLIVLLCMNTPVCFATLSSINSSDFFGFLLRMLGNAVGSASASSASSSTLMSAQSNAASSGKALTPTQAPLYNVQTSTEYSVITLSESYSSVPHENTAGGWSPSREPYHQVEVPKEFTPGWEPSHAAAAMRRRRPQGSRVQVHRHGSSDTEVHRHEESEKRTEDEPTPGFLVRVLSPTVTATNSEVHGPHAANLEDSWPSVWSGSHK